MGTQATDVTIAPYTMPFSSPEGAVTHRPYYRVSFYSVPLNTKCEFAYYPWATGESFTATASVSLPAKKEIKIYHHGDKFKVGKVVCRMKVKGFVRDKRHIWVIDGAEHPFVPPRS